MIKNIEIKKTKKQLITENDKTQDRNEGVTDE